MDEQFRRIQQQAHKEFVPLSTRVAPFLRLGANAPGDPLALSELQQLVQYLEEHADASRVLDYTEMRWPNYLRALDRVLGKLDRARKRRRDTTHHEKRLEELTTASMTPRRDGCLLLFEDWPAEVYNDQDARDLMLMADEVPPVEIYEVWKVDGALRYQTADIQEDLQNWMSWDASLDLASGDRVTLRITAVGTTLDFRLDYPTGPAYVRCLDDEYETFTPEINT